MFPLQAQKQENKLLESKGHNPFYPVEYQNFINAPI